MLWDLLPPEILHILPILLLCLVFVIGRQLPRDILDRGRHRTPGLGGWFLVGGVLGVSGYLLVPVYGPWGVIITTLLCLAIWKRLYYVEDDKVDPVWARI